MEEQVNFEVGSNCWIRRIDFDPKGGFVTSTLGKAQILQRGSSFCLVRGKSDLDEEAAWFQEWVPIQSRRLYLMPAP